MLLCCCATCKSISDIFSSGGAVRARHFCTTNVELCEGLFGTLAATRATTWRPSWCFCIIAVSKRSHSILMAAPICSRHCTIAKC